MLTVLLDCDSDIVIFDDCYSISWAQLDDDDDDITYVDYKICHKGSYYRNQFYNTRYRTRHQNFVSCVTLFQDSVVFLTQHQGKTNQ